MATQNPSPYPTLITDQISRIVQDCEEVVMSLFATLSKYHSGNNFKTAKWSLYEKDQVNKELQTLAGYRNLLCIAFDLAKLSRLEDIKGDTQHITSLCEQNNEILAVVHRLDEQRVENLGLGGPRGYILQRYMDNLTSYVGSTYEGSIVDWNEDRLDERHAQVSEDELEATEDPDASSSHLAERVAGQIDEPKASNPASDPSAQREIVRPLPKSSEPTTAVKVDVIAPNRAPKERSDSGLSHEETQKSLLQTHSTNGDESGPAMDTAASRANIRKFPTLFPVTGDNQSDNDKSTPDLVAGDLNIDATIIRESKSSPSPQETDEMIRHKTSQPARVIGPAPSTLQEDGPQNNVETRAKIVVKVPNLDKINASKKARSFLSPVEQLLLDANLRRIKTNTTSEKIGQLLSQGADPNCILDMERAREQKIKPYVPKYVRLKSGDCILQPAIFAAVVSANVPCINLLLEYGASLNCKGENNETPLIRLLRVKRLDLNFLGDVVSVGADIHVNVGGEWGTPLHAALIANFNPNPATISKLISLGADPNMQSKCEYMVGNNFVFNKFDVCFFHYATCSALDLIAKLDIKSSLKNELRIAMSQGS